MDPAQPNQNKSSTPSFVSLQSEIAHVAEEVYKKNVELAERNKTLSLLRKIDEIILSSVTSTQHIAQQVVDLLSFEEDFKAIIVLLFDKKDNVLLRLAESNTERVKNIEYEYGQPLSSPRVKVTNEENLITQALKTKKLQITSNLYNVLSISFDQDQARRIQSYLQIQSILTYPLVVRDEVIGVMIFGIGDTIGALSIHKKDMINRLSDMVGIALDNAMLYQETQEANERLKQVDRLKDEFVSLASHELRTPMTIIKSYLWLLLQEKKGPINASQKKDLVKTYASTERLINMVNDMLNISRIESGRLEVSLAEVDLYKLIDEIVTDIQPRAQEQAITLTFDASKYINFSALADINRVKQVLINVIGNSLKFTSSGGKITITLFPDTTVITTCVQDSGKGIKEEDLPKLFHKFGILGNNYLTKQNTQGTGLGLYLSKSLIELQGGKMWVKSDGENKGATFCFTLPRA